NDSDENPFDITLAAAVEALPQYQIMDNGDNGFTASAGFLTWGQSGRDGDLHYADTGGNDTASWKFTQLATGEYQAWATWTVASSRPTDASYTVSDADDLLGTVAINQKQLPDDLDSEGSLWESLGTYDIVDGTLEVDLSNNGTRWTIADAIRIEKVGDVVLAPEIQVALGGTDVVDGSTLDLGSTVEGSAVTHTFTVKNSGTDTLTLSSIDGSGLPAGLALASNLDALSLDPQETTTFAVTVAATEVATLGATIQIGNNDSDENPFDITLAAAVEALPQYQIMDNGDNGFTASAGFLTWGQSGR
ncbi:MAG: choice-of-anchor D domain-containing protein, partial [Planctomycetaceae bacterium]|nr:choice-of-anchor D domain-containing protein [Planctomycetaceae bacterium]